MSGTGGSATPGSGSGSAGDGTDGPGRSLRTRLFFTAWSTAVVVNVLIVLVVLAKVTDWCDTDCEGSDVFQDNVGAVLFGGLLIGAWSGICAGVFAVALPNRLAAVRGVAPLAAVAGQVVGYLTMAPWWLRLAVTGPEAWELHSLILFPLPELAVGLAVFVAVSHAARRPARPLVRTGSGGT
ncbi:hypothetical protein [Streptodolium elevatio]|uniref:Uncharacterized protein n=1 Tax=Streptodolium elevatio TaxID=3157996 RepID=A0ABV3DJC8_9ACTN